MVVPPNSNIEFELTVLSHSVFFRPPDTETNDADYEETAENEAYLETMVHNQSGKRWHRYGDPVKAGRCFSKAAEAAERALYSKLPPAPAPPLPPNVPADVIPQLTQHMAASAPAVDLATLDQRWLQLMVSSLNNLAAAHLNSGQPLRAREACIKALEVAPDNITTLLRAGR